MRLAWLLLIMCCGAPRHSEEVTPLPLPSVSVAPVASVSAAPPIVVTEPGIASRWGLDVWVSTPPPSGGIVVLRQDDGSESDRPIARAVVQRVVHRSADAFRRCDTSHATGTVVIDGTIDTSGAVTRAELHATTTMSDSTIAACVVDVFRALQFPQLQGGSATLVYPIRFR